MLSCWVNIQQDWIEIGLVSLIIRPIIFIVFLLLMLVTGLVYPPSLIQLITNAVLTENDLGQRPTCNDFLLQCHCVIHNSRRLFTNLSCLLCPIWLRAQIKHDHVALPVFSQTASISLRAGLLWKWQSALIASNVGWDSFRYRPRENHSTTLAVSW